MLRSDHATIGLPVTITRPPTIGGRPRWTADLCLDGYQSAEPYEAYGDTRADALAELTQLVLRCLANTGRSPVLVIGGANVHPRYMHLIIPERDRFAVHAIHHNAVTGPTGSYPTAEKALDAIMRDVGGHPSVVPL